MAQSVTSHKREVEAGKVGKGFVPGLKWELFRASLVIVIPKQSGPPLYAIDPTAVPAALVPTTARPLRLIIVVPLVEELLVTVIGPVATPAAVWLGFNVSGKVTRDVVNPLPVKVAPSIVTGSVPVDVNVMDRVRGGVHNRILKGDR